MRATALSLVLSCALAAAAPLAAQRYDLTVSVPELESRAQRDSLDPLVHYDLALGYWTQRRYDDAERELRRTIAIEPKTAPAYLALSYLPYARRPKLWEEERRGKVPPELVAAVEESSRLYARAFMVDPMMDLKVMGLMLPPAEWVTSSRAERAFYAEFTRGFVFFWDGRYASAFKWFDDLLRPVPEKKLDKVADFWFWYRGLAAAHLERFDVAAADFQRLLDRATASETTDSLVHFTSLRANEYRYVLAGILDQAGYADSAAALYRAALAQDLGLYMAHARLAGLHEAKRDWLAAVVERRRALETNPEDPSLLYDLGVTLARARDYREAGQVLDQAMAANPANMRVPYMLGLVRLQLGDAPGARAALGRFVSAAPSRFADQVAEVQQRLAALP